MKNVTITIDGKECIAAEGTTILKAAEKIDIKIPTLCAHKALMPYGACRVCLVEVAVPGRPPSLQASCTYPLSSGLVVVTDSEKVTNSRTMVLELLCARCPDAKQIKDLAKEWGVTGGRMKPQNKDCILCGLCVRMCEERMGRSAISFTGKGFYREIASPFGKPNEVCQTCGACDFICPTNKLILTQASTAAPVPIKSEFDHDLISRPAVYIPYPQAVPNVASIDKKTCVRLLTGKCGVCSEFCDADAIDYEQKDQRIQIESGAVILTNGVELFDAAEKKEYGFDRYDNVITSIQFERLLSSSGPTKGEVQRPSDDKHPKKIAFIQCVGSRDPSCNNEFCSSVCCMYSIKEAVIVQEHDPDIESTIFYIDIRSFGKDFERYYENAKNNHGVKFVRCMISKIYEKPKTRNLMVMYMDEAGILREAEFDLVVLAVGMTGTKKHKGLIDALGIETNEYGFCKPSGNVPSTSSREGIYVAGTFAEPKDIPETVAQGSAAAALASACLAEARGSLVKKKEYPPEKNVADEELRIGVFICRCGRNIASVVDVPAVVKHAAGLKNVVHADEFLYSCSKDALELMKKKLTEHNLNRVVIASCTPRTHEELFRDTVREAGLNRYLFEMTSLREQVSWVHKDDPRGATEKSKDLVSMIVAKTARLKPLQRERADVVQTALVIGGGAAGMQAALLTARQGFKTYLLEKEDVLGGHMRNMYYNFEGTDMQLLLEKYIKEIKQHENITVMTKSKIKSISGFTGNYRSLIDCRGEEKEISHGVVIVATGAHAYEPKSKEYGYGESPKITTQIKLEEALANDSQSFKEPKQFVMIQCVGSRSDEHPYCSRVCCSHAIKNALKLKSINPEHRIVILYRDVRTYGFREKYYLKAREEGVVFSCFEKEKPPRVLVKNDSISVMHTDKLLGKEITFKPDNLILSEGIIPGESQELAQVLKVPVTQDGFFLEAHAKTRPLDFSSDGIFVCGLAHSPRFLQESLIQAQGASVRAVTIISKNTIEAKAIIASVNERVCRGCELCVAVCPYDARKMDEDTRIARVIDVQCQGCGACAVACPSGATIHKGFAKDQVFSMIEEAVK